MLGREVPVPEAVQNVARFPFADLCEAPLGATDFIALARRFDVVLIDDIPTIEADKRNTAKRFINLVDALYDNHVKLIASAATWPEKLYEGQGNREAFEFARTASRLVEMRSTDYLASARRSAVAGGSGDSTGLVDT